MKKLLSVHKLIKASLYVRGYQRSEIYSIEAVNEKKYGAQEYT